MKEGMERWWSLWPRLVRNDFAPICYFPLRSASFHKPARMDTPGLPTQQWQSDGDRSPLIPNPGCRHTVRKPLRADGRLKSVCTARSERSDTGWMLTHSILEKLTFEQDLSRAWHLQKAQLKWSHNVFSHFPDSLQQSWQNGALFQISWAQEITGIKQECKKVVFWQTTQIITSKISFLVHQHEQYLSWFVTPVQMQRKHCIPFLWSSLQISNCS